VRKGDSFYINLEEKGKGEKGERPRALGFRFTRGKGGRGWGQREGKEMILHSHTKRGRRGEEKTASFIPTRWGGARDPAKKRI